MRVKLDANAQPVAQEIYVATDRFDGDSQCTPERWPIRWQQLQDSRHSLSRLEAGELSRDREFHAIGSGGGLRANQFMVSSHQSLARTMTAQHPVQVEPGNAKQFGCPFLCERLRFRLAFYCCRCNHSSESIHSDSETVNIYFMDSEGARFKQARRALGLTLKDMAMKTGYSVGTISGVENGHDVPSKRLRRLLIERLALNEDWLVTGKGKMFTEEKSGAMAKAFLFDVWSPEEQAIMNDSELKAFYQRLRSLPKRDRSRMLRAVEKMLEEFQK